MISSSNKPTIVSRNHLISKHFVMDLLASTICLFLLFFSVACNARTSVGHSININSLFTSKPIDTCSLSPTGLMGYGDNHRMRINTKDIICSPHQKPRSKSRQTHHAFLRLDQSRATSLQTRISATRNPSTFSATIPDRPGFDLGTAEYVVIVGFGTPAKPFTVIMDTGSDVSWIQCKPCLVQCYPQREPLFDPSQSSSYSNVSCTDPDCSLVGNDECVDSTCIYDVRYGDGSVSAGFFARETLTLTSSDALTKFEFGCGELNSGFFRGVAGLIGLGRGKVSLASQASQKYGNVFSYCLPASPNSDGFLTFGPSNSNPNLKFTKMSGMIGLPFYFVDLVGLSVGGIDLQIPPTVFSDVGTIIDSGTVITRLPMEAYIALRDEFRKQMLHYRTAPSPSPIFDTCYSFAGSSTIDLPSVELRYSGNVSIDVVPQGLLYPVSTTEGCLAFAGNEDANAVGIIGNRQQLGYEVVFDVGNGMIGFAAGSCS